MPAALLGEKFAAPAQSRKAVFQLGEFDLQHAFLARRMLGENIKDEGDAIDHVTLKDLFEIALLRWGQFLRKDDKIDVEDLAGVCELICFARTHVGRRVGPIAALQVGADGIGSSRVDEACEFLHGSLGIWEFICRSIRADQERLLPQPIEINFGCGEPAAVSLNVPLTHARPSCVVLTNTPVRTEESRGFPSQVETVVDRASQYRRFLGNP